MKIPYSYWPVSSGQTILPKWNCPCRASTTASNKLSESTTCGTSISMSLLAKWQLGTNPDRVRTYSSEIDHPEHTIHMVASRGIS